MRSIARVAQSVAGLVAVVALLSACATAPTQEMSNARQSVQAAQEVGAEEFAARNLDVAREYLARAERELELRYFARARHDAIVAKSEAIKAHNVALALQSAQEALERSSAAPEVRAGAETLFREAMDAARQGRDRRAVRLAEDARRMLEDGQIPD